MLIKRRPQIRISSGGDWSIRLIKRRGPRRDLSTEDRFIQAISATDRVTCVGEYRAEPSTRRSLGGGPLVIDVTVPDGSGYLVSVRHASGAITFSASDESPVQSCVIRRGATSRVLRFKIDAPSYASNADHRGVVAKVLHVFLMKIIGKLADTAIEKAARYWEQHTWKKKGIPKGLLRVTCQPNGILRLSHVTHPEELIGKRNLLFIHGTFSDFASGFAALGTRTRGEGRTFYERIRPVYGERIYAFNHFTVSETPLENAHVFLDALPTGECLFDVITHSRGALVLRSILGCDNGADATTSRFKLGNAVLVAGPNQGTPLASPERWKLYTNWMGNLIDIFPENPFTIGLEFVAEALSWMAGKVGGVIPGLASMNPEGSFLAGLKEIPLKSGCFSSLVSNFEPDRSLLARMADVGIDNFFGTKNDLVVPTEGGWRIGSEQMPLIPGERIGCFGLGGNLCSDGTGPVHHCNYFKQPEAVDFLERGVLGEKQNLTIMDVKMSLPAIRERRSDVPTFDKKTCDNLPSLAATASSPVHPVKSFRDSTYFLDEILNLFILVPPVASSKDVGNEKNGKEFDEQDFARQVAFSTKSQTALMIASFRNARVYEAFRTETGAAFLRWKQIINTQKKIEKYIDGDPSIKYAKLPEDEELREYGRLLFSTLFPGQVRRLYDAARAEMRGRRLNVCLTSLIGWVADTPWEFAFDPSRQMFLCLEEVNFLRNVSTAVPADQVSHLENRPLRILVVAAQPIGAGALSITEEKEAVRRGFLPLIRQGLALVDVITGVTPELLHEILTAAEVERRSYDILHFIGHGEYEENTGFGYLIFEDANKRFYRLRADYFRQIVARRGIQLVFLNACETGMGKGSENKTDFAMGVAPMLVAGGVPAVIANQFKVLDPSAMAFAQHFYWALGVGQSIGDAAREARVAVNYSIAGESIDWAIPILFARNPDDRLVYSGGSENAMSISECEVHASETRRRSSVSNHERVALWDVNNIVPSLDRIVQRLNDVQSYFKFESVYMQAPLGTWRRCPKCVDAPASLDTIGVWDKLKPAFNRLGVKHLCCCTDLPLFQEMLSDAFEYKNGSISILTTDGLLEQMDPPYTSLERLIANSLAFYLNSISAHDKGIKKCPCYFNDERKIEYAAGPLEFCSACKKILKRSDGARWNALDALTKAFLFDL